MLVDAVANQDSRVLLLNMGSFGRQQLADYLNVERTALSKELGKMQSDGLIRVKKNHFKLKH